MPSHPPPLFMEAVDKFEKLALSSPELTTEYLNLERLATLHKLKPKDYLRDVALKQFTLIKATFGRTRPVLEDLSKSPWKLDASAILDVFGPQSLISLEFLKRLRKFAKLDCPVSWDKAKAALDEASNRRLNNPGRGIPRCSWTPSDVTEAMKGLVDDEAERKKKDDTPAATAAQTASPAPSSADNVQDSDADTDDSHEDGLDDFGTNDSDSGSDVRTDSSDADDVEAARRDGLALPDLPTLDVDLDLTDSFVQQSPAHYTAVSCLSSPAPSAHLSEVERGPADRRKDTQSANVPLKRQRSRSFEPDANRSPLKYPRVFQDSEFTGAARRRSPGLPFQPMAPLVEESFSSPYMRPAALGQKEIDSQADHLGRALVDGHVSIRRPPRCSPTVNAMSPRQELQKTDASASRLTSLPGGSGRVNDDSDKGAAAVDTQWPPSNAAEVLQQLDSSQWLKHKTIWTIVELFLPPTQVRILDVAEPSAEQPWDLWASCNPLSRKESDSMLLFPLHLSKRKHWVLMCLDLDRCQASLFDSISDHATTQALGAAARAFVRALGLSWVDGSWTYHNNPRVLLPFCKIDLRAG
ncbi:hypothetical protein IWX90DRAFT_87407 [Phyllosticta citrichinensis]|uniref:Ubiquitin-like protease family profile domain-containing protein n=1 Tax=Phyllosticta citrichinensis TaxID=1130410 RepID=A0ABR1XFH9_9PEZI